MDTTNNYDFRYKSNFRVKHCRITKKAMCLSITGVKNCGIVLRKEFVGLKVFSFLKSCTKCQF